MLDAGLPRVGTGHRAIPRHDVVPNTEAVQILRGVSRIGREGGLLRDKQVQAPLIRRDPQFILRLLQGLYLMVVGSARFFRHIAHNGKGGGLGRKGQGRHGAAEHMEFLPLLQGGGIAGGTVPAVDPEGLAGHVHHVFAVLLGIHVQAGERPVFVVNQALDLPVVQIAGREGRYVFAVLLCRGGSQGRDAAKQGAAQRQGSESLFHGRCLLLLLTDNLSFRFCCWYRRTFTAESSRKRKNFLDTRGRIRKAVPRI